MKEIPPTQNKTTSWRKQKHKPITLTPKQTLYNSNKNNPIHAHNFHLSPFPLHDLQPSADTRKHPPRKRDIRNQIQIQFCLQGQDFNLLLPRV